MLPLPQEMGGNKKQTCCLDCCCSLCQFRNEYVRILSETGVKEEIAIQIIGHANALMVHEVYMHLNPSVLSEAASLLNLHLSNE